MSRRWDWSAPQRVPRPWSVGGIGVGLVLILLGRPWFGGATVALAGTVTVAWFVSPRVTAAWIRRFSETIGRAIGIVSLTAVFGLVVVPLALVRRGDPLALKFPGEGSTFWRKRDPRAPDSRRRWS